MADAVEDCEEIVDRREAKQALAELAALKTSASRRISPEGAGKTRRSPMATLRPGRTRARQRFSPAGSVSMTSMWPVGSFTVADESAAGVETGGNDAAVVEDEQIAGVEQVAELRKMGICESAGGAIEHQHAARAALGGRLLRNQLRRQIEIEVGDEVSALLPLEQSSQALGLPEVGEGAQAGAFDGGVELFALWLELFFRRDRWGRASTAPN